MKAENDPKKDSSRVRPKKSVAAKTGFDIFKTQKEAMKQLVPAALPFPTLLQLFLAAWPLFRYASLSKQDRDEKIRAEFDKLPKDMLDFLESLAQK